jgi:predicted MFS family arabinose efflux permease
MAMAAMVPQVLSIIQLHVPREQRARAMGTFSMVLALGVALGQVLGGVLVASDAWGLGWRLPFLAQVPVSGIVLLAAARSLPHDDRLQAPSVDVVGIALLSAGLSAVLVPLTVGPELGWPAWTWPCLGAGVLALAGLAPVERRIRGRGGQPLLDPDVFAVPGVKAGLLVVWVSMGAYASLQLVVSLYVQSGLGLGSLPAGLTFACYALGFGVVNLNWPRLSAAAHRWIPAAGLGLLGGAALALALEAAAGWRLGFMLPALAAAGSGHGAAYGPLLHRLATPLAPERAATLSGLVPTVTQLAGVVGVVTTGGLYLRAAGAVSSTHGLAVVASVLGAAALAALPGAVRTALPAHPNHPLQGGGGDRIGSSPWVPPDASPADRSCPW